MKKDIFENNAHPFTVPEGYFDTLQDRIMNRIRTEKGFGVRVPSFEFRVPSFAVRALVAAAACVLFIFIGAAVLYMVKTERQPVVAKSIVDDDFYQWVYASDRATFLAESLNIHTPESIMENENGYFEEDEAIISFLERDNINVLAILMVSD